MKKKTFFIISLFIFVQILFLYNKSRVTIPIITYFCFDDMLTVNNNTKEIPPVFLKMGIIPVDSYKHADLLFTHNHDQFVQLSKLDHYDKCKYIYGLRCINLFACKRSLYLTLKQDFPSIIPKTWALHSTLDMRDLTNQFEISSGKPIKALILKSNVQRQKGIKFVKDIRDIYDRKSKYVVCQEILENPLLIHERKIDLRIYVLIVCYTNSFKFYIYKDGFIYYTKEKHTPHNVQFENTISSGYRDRSVYKDNPLTLDDLYKHLGKHASDTLKINIVKCFTGVKHSYTKTIKRYDIGDGVNRFVILGADVCPNDTHDVKLLEINKGPDLRSKDSRDEQLKENLIKHTLYILKNPNISNANFIEII